ncbi:MAG TPA: PfkB family carbohydrate kinase [Verrucomicrobiota bacterium]|nr:PfkB family carbohydrate kinase [Verrucomicrobiota bacterium]HNT14869.1 PfkB family carbohydrate kinase [Verrucomicrobiota bacterium]
MTTTPELRATTARQLQTSESRAASLHAFVGLDGFVDEILHVVDKRESAEKFTRLPTIAKYAERLAHAAGHSTNVELIRRQTKLGGNGPIMANALASFAMKVCYLGNLGYPNIHPVFADFSRRAEVHTLAEPGYTDALEFEDGKIMCGKLAALYEVNWENLQRRFGVDSLLARMQQAQFLAFANWTMLTGMNDIWEAVQREVCPKLTGLRRTIFFDLADPEKRTHADVLRALGLITGFEKYFDAILGLNEKEAYEIGGHLDLDTSQRTPDGLLALAQQIHARLQINTVVIHPVSYALAVSANDTALVEGPYTPQPLITTGAGDHFNAGFCLGKLLGFKNAQALLTGVSTSGFYVRTGKSPAVADLAGFLQNWPGTA